jgi:ketosteroid isomerase-like protein
MMRHFAAVIVIALCALAPVPDALAQKVKHAPSDAIRAADQEWLKVFAAKDLEKSVAFCAEDGSVLAPNAPIATGRPAISQLFTVFFSLPEFNIQWLPSKVSVARSGEMGYSTGTYQLSFKGPAGTTIADHGKYVTVWQKQGDGSWKVALDIFNSDLPAATP